MTHDQIKKVLETLSRSDKMFGLSITSDDVCTIVQLLRDYDLLLRKEAVLKAVLSL
jgi:hypothetical protein